MMESLGMSGRIENTRKDREYLESLGCPEGQGIPEKSGMPGRTGNVWKNRECPERPNVKSFETQTLKVKIPERQKPRKLKTLNVKNPAASAMASNS